ncbi:MAG: hypothetical protein K2Q14_05630 [Gammaproteobacteria bacterium]|nr:hypothetical protein [Gammaproteobacteria bacterium]
MRIFAPLFILFVPFIYFVKFNDVPIFHEEFVWLIMTILAASLCTSLILYRARWVRLTMVFSLLIPTALSFLPEFQSMLVLKVVFLVVLCLGIFLKEKALAVVTFIAGVFCTATLLFPVGHEFNTVKISQKATKSNSHLPPIIHIVFDEHMGVNAIPTNTPQGVLLQNKIKQFYPHYGFRLYANAYSRYSRTYDAIPNDLNFIPQAQDSYYFPGGPSEQILKQNKEFQLLSQLGYNIRVYQPNYIDFCHAKRVNYEFCYTYPIFSLKAFYQLQFPSKVRYQFLLKTYLLSSFLYQQMVYEYTYTILPLAVQMHLHLPPSHWEQNELSTLQVLSAMQKLQSDVLTNADEGTVFFAHILLPHSPYIYDENCQIHSNPMDWLINYDVGPQGNTAERRALRYALYEKQTQCLYRQLQTIFDSWQQAGIMSKAIIIVQGDHSSRLPVTTPTMENKGESNWRDFNDSFPALFAVKAPHYLPGLDESLLAISYLLGTVMRSITQQSFPIDSSMPYVYLTDKMPNTRVMQEEELLSGFKNSD